MDLLIIVVAFGFIAISRSILVASGKAPPPKPLTKKGRWTLHPIVWLFIILYTAGVLFAMIADGGLDFL